MVLVCRVSAMPLQAGTMVMALVLVLADLAMAGLALPLPGFFPVLLLPALLVVQ